jgi:hypothetical protein
MFCGFVLPSLSVRYDTDPSDGDFQTCWLLKGVTATNKKRGRTFGGYVAPPQCSFSEEMAGAVSMKQADLSEVHLHAQALVMDRFPNASLARQLRRIYTNF